MKAVVFAIGNPLREDDGMGWRAADLLEAALEQDEAVIRRVHQLTPELVTDLEGAPLALFLDADATSAPGALATRLVQPSESGGDTHRYAPAELLGFARTLGITVRTAFLIGGGPASMGHGERLSDSGDAAAHAMARAALAIIRGQPLP